MSVFLGRWFSRRKLEKIRLTPLKVLLYLESTERKERVTSPGKLRLEIGMGGYDPVRQSYIWLLDHGYIAPAPGTPDIAPSELLDPREFVVTPLGKEALKPHLKAFSLGQALEIALLAAIAFFLGWTYVLYQLYPEYMWLEGLIGLVAAAPLAVSIIMVLRIEARRRKNRALHLLESVVDRDPHTNSESE